MINDFISIKIGFANNWICHNVPMYLTISEMKLDLGMKLDFENYI
jgi:hypothetical protein